MPQVIRSEYDSVDSSPAATGGGIVRIKMMSITRHKKPVRTFRDGLKYSSRIDEI